MRIIIAAAGTGGHINPGIAIANKIKQEEKDSKIIFIGTKRGLEVDLVPKAGYELKIIDSYGISRSFSVRNIRNMSKTLKSIIEVKKIIKEFKPDVVIGTGGYISVSACAAAEEKHIPYIIHESNAMPGVATKIFARRANKILLGFEEAKNYLDKNANCVHTGTPCKIKSLNYDEDTIQIKKKELGFDKDLPLVLVFGGSQGASSINNSIIDIIVNYRFENNYQIALASGPRQYEIIKAELKQKNINIDNIKGVKIHPYIYDMEEYMNICDLMVTRAGAMTITEIEKLGKASIFIPYPYATENHQEYNARSLEKRNAGYVILDKELTGEKLDAKIKELVLNKRKLEQMSKNAKELSINNVEDKIYVEIKTALQ